MKRVLFLLGLGLSVLGVGACHKPQRTSSALVLDSGVKGVTPGLIKEAPHEPTALSPEREFAPIFFPFDKSDLSYDAMLILDDLAAFLEANPSTHLLIAGHADERGTEEYNLALGQERAESVKRYLMLQRIAPNRISTTSYGEEVPLSDGEEESSLARNRRAELGLYAVESKPPKKEIRLYPIPDFKLPSLQGM